MKIRKPIALLAVFTIVSCHQTQKSIGNEQINEPNKLSPDWILGSWIRINDKPGQITYEEWYKKKDSTYKGKGYTIEGRDTIFQENLEIKTSKKQKTFTALLPHQEKTEFKITEESKFSFTCNNPNNEFPKVIEYSRFNDTLKAQISGGGPTIIFSFVKNKQPNDK